MSAGALTQTQTDPTENLTALPITPFADFKRTASRQKGSRESGEGKGRERSKRRREEDRVRGIATWLGNQTFRTMDFSYHRRFVPLVDFSYHGRFVPWIFRTILGLFVPFVPWTFRTILGLFVPSVVFSVFTPTVFFCSSKSAVYLTSRPWLLWDRLHGQTQKQMGVSVILYFSFKLDTQQILWNEAG